MRDEFITIKMGHRKALSNSQQIMKDSKTNSCDA